MVPSNFGDHNFSQWTHNYDNKPLPALRFFQFLLTMGPHKTHVMSMDVAWSRNHSHANVQVPLLSCRLHWVSRRSHKSSYPYFIQGLWSSRLRLDSPLVICSAQKPCLIYLPAMSTEQSWGRVTWHSLLILASNKKISMIKVSWAYLVNISL